jgi:hypothetical protein
MVQGGLDGGGLLDHALQVGHILQVRELPKEVPQRVEESINLRAKFIDCHPDPSRTLFRFGVLNQSQIAVLNFIVHNAADIMIVEIEVLAI